MNGENGLLENVQQHVETESELTPGKKQWKKSTEARNAVEMQLLVNTAMPVIALHVRDRYILFCVEIR